MTSEALASPAVRLDRWLWAARFFKTRGLAQESVEGGHVSLNGARVKPAHALKSGDRLEIRAGAYEWRIAVRALSVRRGPATVARLLYEEAEESIRARQEAAARLGERDSGAARQGRPTKRDRRQLDQFTDGD